MTALFCQLLLINTIDVSVQPAQEPVLRTACHRVAFQSSTSDLVRVSIDTDLTFTKVCQRV